MGPIIVAKLLTTRGMIKVLFMPASDLFMKVQSRIINLMGWVANLDKITNFKELSKMEIGLKGN